jgi:hypothetical protein
MLRTPLCTLKLGAELQPWGKIWSCPGGSGLFLQGRISACCFYSALGRGWYPLLQGALPDHPHTEMG